MKDDAMRFPMKVAPEPVDRLWGGREAERIFGWAAPEGRTVGEWWILSFREDHSSKIADGPLAGLPLSKLRRDHPSLLGGDEAPSLLIKILDSAQALSVQVHPDDALAHDLKLDSGKTESWYYLESRPGAFIYHGLAEGVSPEAFFEAIRENPSPDRVDALLRRVPVRDGALSFIPAGTIHAVGAGVLLMEVQQNSDTTFRIYDWGRPREVHVNQAERAVLEARPEPAEVRPEVEEGLLVSCARFHFSRHRPASGDRLPGAGERYAALTCLDGSGRIEATGYAADFVKGDTWFLPARSPELTVTGETPSVWMRSAEGRALDA